MDTAKTITALALLCLTFLFHPVFAGGFMHYGNPSQLDGFGKGYILSGASAFVLALIYRASPIPYCRILVFLLGIPVLLIGLVLAFIYYEFYTAHGFDIYATLSLLPAVAAGISLCLVMGKSKAKQVN